MESDDIVTLKLPHWMVKQIRGAVLYDKDFTKRGRKDTDDIIRLIDYFVANQDESHVEWGEAFDWKLSDEELLALARYESDQGWDLPDDGEWHSVEWYYFDDDKKATKIDGELAWASPEYLRMQHDGS